MLQVVTSYSLMLQAPKLFSWSNDKSVTKMAIVKYYMKLFLSSSRIEKSPPNTLPKPIDFHLFKNVLLELFSLQLCLFFFSKKMKFYKGILPHQNKKASSPFYHEKIFLTENECKRPWGVFYIHFLSKIFFMIKWT